MGGTYGSLAAIPLCVLAVWGGIWGYVLITACVYVLGIWSIPIAEEAMSVYLGDKKDRREHDQNEIVIDEVEGMLITFFPLLWEEHVSGVKMALAFALFRLFDISKPPPCRYFDRMTSASGVMLDDVFAGVYAASAFALTLAYVF